MTVERIAEIACEDLNLGHQVLVHIAIHKIGDSYKLQMYPKRGGDTVVFHTVPTKVATLEKPREVRWVVHGLETGQRVVIRAKAPGLDETLRMFPQDEYEIVHPCNTVRTGEAMRSPAPALDLTWGYGVELWGPASTTEPLHSIDPIVIIKDDP